MRTNQAEAAPPRGPGGSATTFSPANRIARAAPALRPIALALTAAAAALWAHARAAAGLPLAGLTWAVAACLAALAVVAVAASVAAGRRARARPQAPIDRLVRGPHRVDFTPHAVVGHSLIDLVAAALVIAAAAITAPPACTKYTLGLALACTLGGALLWRYRSPRAWLQLATSVGVAPVCAALAALCTLSVSGVASAAWAAAAAALSGFVLGAHGAALVEQEYAGPRRALLMAAWAGVAHVHADGSLTLAGKRRARPGEGRPLSVPASLDIRPLLAAVTREDAAAFTGLHLREHAHAGRRSPTPLFLVAVPIFIVVVIPEFVRLAPLGGSPWRWVWVGTAVGLCLLLLLSGGLGVLRRRIHATAPADILRLTEFARKNRLRYEHAPSGDRATVVRRRTVTSKLGWHAANTEHENGQLSDAVAPTTYLSGYAEFRLPTRLPHLLLIRTGSLAPGLLAKRRPAPGQRLPLEGDFHRSFTVYCPSGYERDALYLLTPDVMAALVDGAQGFDVEIVDDRLLLRTRRDLVTLDPGIWLSLLYAAERVIERTTQWRRWRDDRRDDRLELAMRGTPAVDSPAASAADPPPTAESPAPPHLLHAPSAGPARAGARLRGALNPVTAVGAGLLLASLAFFWVAALA
ncbi:hypothetical protein ACFSWE_11195 [Leucobacter albus]|uniref:Uncharacterized protein n=1 Tax=Leucobacter albus TaxID=272210 RepID=A0ABW3TTD4_9MICO